MSVVGIDVGNFRSKVAVARRGGIDVAVNHVSNRETPTIVSFNGSERFIGESATTQVTTNPKNTVTNLMMLLGRKFDDPMVQLAQQSAVCSFVPDNADGGVNAQVQYQGEQCTFSPQRLLAMMLSDLRSTAEGELSTKVIDCVIAVPGSFGARERQAMLDAAAVIGLNPLCLINNTTAAALQWGFYRSPEEGQISCFVDCGHESLDVAIVKYTKDKMDVLGTASNLKLSAAAMDQVIADHLREQFQESFKIDAYSRPRAKVRLLQASEKAKRVLSANPQCPVNIECLMDDTDVRANLTREQLEEWCAPMLTEAEQTVQRALKMAGLSAEQVTNVEVIGGMSWVPCVTQTVSDVFSGKQVGRTLNASDSVAKGACLMCAMLSMTLRVRDFVVNDIYNDAVVARWLTTDGSQKEVVLFAENSAIPSRKLLSFQRDEPFEIALFQQSTNQELLKVKVSGMKNAEQRQQQHLAQLKEKGVEEESEAPPNRIKVSFDLTRSGLLQAHSAHVVEEYEVRVETKASDAAQDGDSEMKDASQEQAAPEADKKPEAEATPAAAAEPQVEWKKKTRKVNIVIAAERCLGWNAQKLEQESTHEWSLVAKDREIKATQDARNNLEAFVYDMKDKLSNSGRLAPFLEDSLRLPFLETLTTCEDWLYTEEADESTCAVFEDKLADLRSTSDPADARRRESELRDDARRKVEDAVQAARDLANSQDAKYSHVSQEDRDKCLAKCLEVEQLLTARMEEVNSQPKTENPKFTCQQIGDMAKEVTQFVAPIMNQPKPKPPAKEKKDDKETKEGGAQAEQQAPGANSNTDTNNTQDTPAPEAAAAPENNTAPQNEADEMQLD